MTRKDYILLAELFAELMIEGVMNPYDEKGKEIIDEHLKTYANYNGEMFAKKLGELTKGIKA